MISRFLALCLLPAFTVSAFAEQNVPAPTPTPHNSVFRRMGNIFHKDKKTREEDEKKSKSLDLSMEISPQPLKLSESHEIHVTLRLTNNTGKIVQLDFPTTQRIEVLLRNENGKMVTQWSENQSFDNDFGYVTINSHEHVEYSVTISGRDMAAGRTYTIEGFFPNYEKLRTSKTIIPVK